MKKEKRNDRMHRFPRKGPRAIEDVVTRKRSSMTLETSWPLADCENVFTGIEENKAREGKSCKLVTKVMAMAIVRPRGRGEKNL